MKIGICIPCYQVAHSIEKVIKSFTPDVLKNIDEILVIDNCSKDATLETLLKIKKSGLPSARKLTAIRNASNFGLGGSQKVAFRYFMDRHFSHVMVIHGDGQGDANEIALNFLNSLYRNPEIELFTASRFLPDSELEGYNFKRLVGNKFFNLLTRFLTGYDMTDAGAGIVLVNLRRISKIPFETLDDGYHFNPTLNILLYEEKIKTKDIPLKWRDSEDHSNVRIISYCMKLLLLLLRYRLAKMGLVKKPWSDGLSKREYKICHE